MQNFQVGVIIKREHESRKSAKEWREVLEEYVKIILYAYPYLKRAGKDYEEHIKNMAVLSFDNKKSAESLLEEIAEELIVQKKLLWLKEKVEEVFHKLSALERLMLEIRYFGRKRKFAALETELLHSGEKLWNDRKYFRQQEKLGEKVNALFQFLVITKEEFEKDYAYIDLFRRAKKYADKQEKK